MIVLRAYGRPKFGSNAELTDQLKKWVDYRAGKGERAVVSRQILGQGGPVYSAVTFHDSLNAMEESRQKSIQDQEYITLISGIQGVMSGHASYEILDTLVPLQEMKTANYALRVSVVPKLGSLIKLKEVLTEWVKLGQSKGGRTALMQVLYGQGPMFVQRMQYDSLGDLEKERGKIMASSEYQAFLKEFTQHATGYPDWTISEGVAHTD